MKCHWLKKAKKLSDAIDVDLKSTDERFNRKVEIFHMDGSVLTFANAFLMIGDIDGHECVFCFTEHLGYHVYDSEDLDFYGQYKKMSKIEKIEKVKDIVAPDNGKPKKRKK